MMKLLAIALFATVWAVTSGAVTRCAQQMDCDDTQCCSGVPFFGAYCRPMTPEGGKCNIKEKVNALYGGDSYMGMSCPCDVGMDCVATPDSKKNKGVCTVPPTTAAPEVPTDAPTEAPEVPSDEATEAPEEPKNDESSESPEEPKSNESGDKPEEPKSSETAEQPEEPKSSDSAEQPEEPKTDESAEEPAEPKSNESAGEDGSDNTSGGDETQDNKPDEVSGDNNESQDNIVDDGSVVVVVEDNGANTPEAAA